MDPFDLNVFSPYMTSNLNKHLQRCGVSLVNDRRYSRSDRLFFTISSFNLTSRFQVVIPEYLFHFLRSGTSSFSQIHRNRRIRISSFMDRCNGNSVVWKYF